ncbi:MAG: aldehyde dehydrogenase family protein, partial [Microcystaceae cyanobacterium]
IAPDYLLVQEAILEPLISALKTQIQVFYGENPALSPDYCRIVNVAQFHRLTQLLADGEVLYGGDYQEGDRYFAPTLMHRVNLQSPLMQEEIFGPILPILSYQTLEEAIAFVNQRPKPLALYFFSNNLDHQEAILQKTSSGGVCINDVILQVGVTDLPFGGVGDSGMGRYHGKTSFDTFCHYKSVLRKFFWLELALRYPPYTQKLSLIKWFVK